MVGRRWRDLKNQLAAESLRTDQLAKDIINGTLPQIYVLNHAYGTWQIEHSANINTAYTLYNREAIERIIREDPEMLPPPGPRMTKKIAEGKAERWTKQKLQSDMMQGILQGDSIPELAKRIAGSTERRAMTDAVRYARTMTTGAQNAGRYDSYRRARDLGIDLVIEWTATLDNRTRHAHREMHGQRTTVDEPFYTPDGFTIMYPGQGGEDIPQRTIWNCRCTLLAWVAGFEHETMRESDDVDDFDEWLEGHSESRPILSQWDTGEAIRMQYARRYRDG